MDYLFLIGGIDLEMLEIISILNQHSYTYINKNLRWDNAKWEAYSDVINDEKYKNITFVGIELTEDKYKPKDAIEINHHNYNSDKESSLEQIAILLNIELSRKQKLIAANDKAYIQGMEMLCATKEEIENIRQLDKAAQGVTIEDEEEAKESIAKHKEEINGVIVIKSLSDKFSPITDLIYGKTSRLLIYNDDSLNYYGNIADLITGYDKEIKENKAFFGGGKKSGYFGLAKGSWTKEEIETEINIITTIMSKANTEKIYSYHIFLFPFRWSNWEVKKDALLDDKFKLKTFRENLEKNTDVWKRAEGFQLTHYDHYNEYNYFYEYVREILYDLGKDLSTSRTTKNNTLINHFEYSIPDGKPLYYNIKIKGETTPYHLQIDSILLNIYSTGTGVLSFHLRNHDYSDKDTILRINKYGRRIFVPFFGLEKDSIYNGLKDNTKEEKLLCSTKKYEIPEAIWVGEKYKPDENGAGYIKYENFEHYKNKDTFKNGPFILPKFITGLFPDNFFLVHEKQGYLGDDYYLKNKDYKVYLRPVLDDRMYVVSWYGNTELVDTLKHIEVENKITRFPGNKAIVQKQKKNHYAYEKSDWWYNYTYIDTSPMQTDEFERQKMLHHQTYSRWVSYGTLYGISRYSLVMLTSDFSDLERYDTTYLVRHLQSMYYKMAELTLLQRATVLSYSDEVTHTSNLLDDDENIIDRIESLYKHYILFVNKIYFREITAQEQGIEMYDMLQRTMRIPQDVKDLDNEIDELNRFASMLQEKKERKESEKHTRLATVFLPLMAVSGVLGISFLKTNNDKEILNELFSSQILIWSTLILLTATVLFINWKRLQKRNLHIPILILFFWGILMLTFILKII